MSSPSFSEFREPQNFAQNFARCSLRDPGDEEFCSFVAATTGELKRHVLFYHPFAYHDAFCYGELVFRFWPETEGSLYPIASVTCGVCDAIMEMIVTLPSWIPDSSE